MKKASKTSKHTPSRGVTGRSTAPEHPSQQQVAKSGNGNKPISTTLAKSLITALPTAVEVMGLLAKASDLLPKIEAELNAAKSNGAVTLARAYVVLHRLSARAAELLQVSDSGKVFGPTMKQWATVEVPAAFEQAGVTHIPLDEGYRVGLSSQYRASIKPDQKEAAYDWLRENGLEALIVGTVNASTLSAAAKNEIENNNKEFPEDLFSVAIVPNTSVTASK